jgi:hypothetical protein
MDSVFCGFDADFSHCECFVIVGQFGKRTFSMRN